MLGLMQDWPLLCQRVIEHGAREHGERRVVTREPNGRLHITNYREMYDTARRISRKLLEEGVTVGDRIGTLGWSTARHAACWYGIAGIGAIYHPINARLFSEQILHIINHAEDRLLFVDPCFLSLLEPLGSRIPSIKKYIVMCDQADMPDNAPPGAVSMERWLEGVDATDYTWDRFDENTAATLTYTSGTTGNPKGVLYSHRSVVLMSMAAITPDMYSFSARDVVLQIVPMYHANAWTWPFSAPMTGASLVFPGHQMDGASITDLLIEEQITVTGGVPTIWQTVLDCLQSRGLRLQHLRRVFVGGAPCSKPVADALIEQGVEVRPAYGMTEMGPLGSVATLRAENEDIQGEDRLRLLQSQGRPPFMVETRCINDNGHIQPRNGKSVGHLQVRGPCILHAYYRSESHSLTEDGYLDTGDIASIDELGYIHLTDRAKDLVKSGGEWISSIDMEHAAVSHPNVHEAAVIGAKHPTWDERPLLFIVPRAETKLTREELYAHLKDKMAKWWLPDDILFVDELPHTAIGKLNKVALRQKYGNYLMDQIPSATKSIRESAAGKPKS